MKNKNSFKLIQNHKEQKRANSSFTTQPSPIKQEMVEFMHQSLFKSKDVFEGFTKFKPKDL